MNDLYVYFRFNGKYYKYMKLVFHSHIDGSLYLAFYIQSKKNTNCEALKVSIHTTGRINYQMTGLNETIFIEPIYEITRKHDLFMNCLNNFDKLFENLDCIKDNDLLIDLPDSLISTLNLRILITPLNFFEFESNEIEISRIKFNTFFDLIICSVLDVNEFQDKLNELGFAINKYGLYKSQIIDKDCALINFHQKATKNNDIIIYSPNNEGVWKIIHTVPMRISPRLNIQFDNPTYKAIKIETQSTVAISKFIVKDKHNNKIKNIVKILCIELDSEL